MDFLKAALVRKPLIHAVGCYKNMKIPEIKLKPIPETEEAKRVLGYKWNNEAGTHHKLGGTPDWLQSEDIPLCPDCHKPMSFYGQLDSIGDEFDLADCGMIYVFVCFDCFTTQSILQSS